MAENKPKNNTEFHLDNEVNLSHIDFIDFPPPPRLVRQDGQGAPRLLHGQNPFILRPAPQLPPHPSQAEPNGIRFVNNLPFPPR
ncbi:MAG: hypothetical protein SFW66_03575 [Gammaproteobacteria bacterium]|nr:hypothetical protein [Gammaproteobacteria bacterium]